MSHPVEDAEAKPSRAPSLMRHGRLRSTHPLTVILKFLGAAVAVVAISAASVGGYAVYSTVSNIKPGIHLTHVAGAKAVPPPSVGAVDGEVNILLAGSDSRTGQVGFQTRADLAGSSGLGNNDVTMVLHVSADHTNATVVSFPRDLVNFPMCGRSASSAMFNTTLSRGLSCTLQTAEKMTGLTIPYAGVIKFNGVSDMSNAIGGVTVCLATPVKDPYTNPQLDLAAGPQILVGPTALSFLRSRHGVGDGSDIGRISNQQIFLSALVRKITTDGVLSNPVTLYKLATAATSNSNLQLSDTLTNPTGLMSVALALKGIALDKIVFLQYPTTSDPADVNRVIAIPSAATALVSALNSDQPIALSGKLGRAAVADPSAAVPSPNETAQASAAPVPGETASSTPGAIELPSSITGQNASQQTCSAKTSR